MFSLTAAPATLGRLENPSSTRAAPSKSALARNSAVVRAVAAAAEAEGLCMSAVTAVEAGAMIEVITRSCSSLRRPPNVISTLICLGIWFVGPDSGGKKSPSRSSQNWIWNLVTSVAKGITYGWTRPLVASNGGNCDM
jgi:hypothetical protein